MEGQTVSSNKLRFHESKRKLKLTPDLRGRKLIAAANDHGLLVFTEDQMLRAIQYDQLLDFNQANVITANQCQFSYSLSFKPNMITVTRHGYSSLVLIIGTNQQFNYPVVEAFDLNTQTSIGKLDLNEFMGSEIVDYAWHPNYYDSIVALCSSSGHLLVVGVNKKDKGISLVYKSDKYRALTCCWSPKGKNLAIGMSDGGIFRLEPVVAKNSFTFKEVDKSRISFTNPKITPQHQLIKLRWINKTYLMSVHARLGNPSGTETVYSILTVKPSKPYLYWTNICFENQLSSQTYNVHLANLTNSVVCATSAAGEAAVIGVLGMKEATTNDLNDWNSINIEEEGARIELPLDANNRETYTMAVTTAFVKTSQFQEIINRPIVILLSSDGLVCPYVAIHSEDILKLPEFQAPLTFELTVSSGGLQQQQQQQQQAPLQQSAFGSSPLSTFGGSPAFGGGLSLGSTSTFGGSPAFGGPPAFGGSPSFTKSPSLGGPATFGSGLSLGSGLTNTSAFGAGLTSTSNLSGFQGGLSSTTNTNTTNTGFGGAATFQNSFQSLASGLSSTLNTMTSAPAKPKTPEPQPPKPVVEFPKFEPAKFEPPKLDMPRLPEPVQASEPAKVEQPVRLLAAPPRAETPRVEPPPPAPTPAPPKPLADFAPKIIEQPNQPAQQQPSIQANIGVQKAAEPQAVESGISPTLAEDFSKEIEQVRKQFDYNEAYLSIFEELNHLRNKLEEVQDIHVTHREALNAVREDIDALDLALLETFYLIEYINARKGSRKRSIDPMTAKRVDSIKVKTSQIEKKLEELNDNVDVAWEDYIRRKTAAENKQRRANSLDIIYKSLTTNQKIINLLKKKINVRLGEEPSVLSKQADKYLVASMHRRETDTTRFQEFLASRNVVPVREPLKASSFYQCLSKH